MCGTVRATLLGAVAASFLLALVGTPGVAETGSGVARDVGGIAILEHDGSNYDARLPNGKPNYEARAAVGRRFYETHPDAYDFLVVFTNFEFKTDDATAFHMDARNDVSGIGIEPGPVAEEPFGSPSRLKGWIDMAAVSRYRVRPLSLTPGDPGFLATLNVLAHEVGHQWLAQVRYLDGGVVSDALLGKDEAHWSYLLDSDASVMYGADWRDRGDGTFAAARVKEQYSALDLYLMGFLPPEKVPPFTLLQSPGVHRHLINRVGAVVAATPATVTIEQVVAANGPRVPDATHSQKEFRLGFVFLAAPGTEPTPEDLEAVERVRRAFGAHFFALTHGVAWADTSLGVRPPGPVAPVPDLDRALAWLVASQGLDGSWADSLPTAVRDTAAAVRALARAGATGPAWQRGQLWLQQAQPESLDFQARSGAALADAGRPGLDPTTRVSRLLSAQNADGGFGAGRDFASDPLDTALALRALHSLGHPPDSRVQAGIGSLAVLANPDGGWSAVPGGETSTVVTAEVLLALLDWRDLPAAAALQASGLAALLARQNPDGGFGSSPSTPFASALTLDALLRGGAPAAVVDPLTAWLEQSQRPDGSWEGSAFQTALVLAALSEARGANLVVPADSLVLAPNPAPEGDVVRVTAHVRNAGRSPAPASVARLFDGTAADGPWVAEAAVPALAPGQEAEVGFDFPTADRPGPHTLSVVADAAGAIAESREDDNTTAAALTVVGLLADLVVTPASIAVAPSAPEVGEAATVTVTVANVGERLSPEAEVLLEATDPGGRTTVLPLAAAAPLAPGETATVSFPWTPSVDGTHILRARVDPRFAVAESSETNNAAERFFEVLTSAPDEAELAVRGVRLSPDTLRALPEALEVRAVVDNVGRAAASSSLAVFDGPGGTRLATVAVDIGPRDTATAEIPVTIHTPGTRPLVVQVDPDDLLPEENELDNSASATLTDEGTLDVGVSAATLSSADVEVGEPVEVTVEVTNHGTLPVFDLPVQLARDDGGTLAELARTTTGIEAGESRTLSLQWSPVVAEETVRLVVRADPFDLLVETREDDNALALILHVRPSALPNLAVSGAEVTIDPDPPREGENATIGATVRNTGTVPSGPCVVRFFLGDPEAGGTPIADASLGALSAGAAATVAASWPSVAVRGSLGLFVVADALDEVAEFDEDDNRAFRPLTALGRPDLVLATGDVVLDPGYPRAGEAVTVHATVRNLGGLSSTETTLEVAEGEGDASVVGVLPVPPLAPGGATTLSLGWTPASPPGPRVLRLRVDPDDRVTEQDEGNNAVDKTVVVQDADLYLTEPYFSPNGDGVKDETTLAWRSTDRVRVVVSDEQDRLVRVLADDGPEEGSATWDGRDGRGVVAVDGSYWLSLTGQSGALLARKQLFLDTNRSPIHDSAPGETAVRNVTCLLPEGYFDTAWMPGGEELLLIARGSSPGVPAGLLRVGLDGSYGYVATDDWFSASSFPSPAAVSPDGREVLLLGPDGLVAVDLATGARRTLGGWANVARWSPDGRWILADERVLAPDGTLQADLGELGPGSSWGYASMWAWSPASDRLAAGNVVASRDGQRLAEVPLPPDVGEVPEWASWLSTAWRGDGTIVAQLNTCEPDYESEECQPWLEIDPEAGTARRLDWRPAGVWSPDGSRVIVGGELFERTGRSRGYLLPRPAQVSPFATAALYQKYALYDPQLPGQVCGDKDHDLFAVTTLANLTADLRVARLAGNNGLVVRGTAADRNLDHLELDYARQDEPGVWHPIGPASEAPVVDDEFTVWVPPAPGTYAVRLRVFDRAGNVRRRARVVSWTSVASIANFTQDEYFVSPNGDGVKDEVRFRYTVVEPTRLDVRIVGPELAGPGSPAAPEVRRMDIEHPDVGPYELVWDGRDDTNQVVPDGRYTVSLNGLPFRVEVDDTPPEIGWRLDDLHVREESFGPPVCGYFGGLSASVNLGTVVADRSRHVVDPHLRSWTLSAGGAALLSGTEALYVAETDEDGLPILDGGVPRVRRSGGRPVDRRDEDGSALAFARFPGFQLEAEDHAGNRSEVAVPAVPESAWPLGAAYGCNAVLTPPVESEAAAVPPAPPRVHALAPEKVVLVAGATLQRDPAEQGVRFSFAPREGGAAHDVTMSREGRPGLWYLPVESFEALGADPIQTYRGRFVGDGADGDVSSESFLFTPCPEWLLTRLEMPPGAPVPFLVLRTQTDDPVVEAWVELRQGAGPWTRVEMQPMGGDSGVFATPALLSCDPPRYKVHARTASGRVLPDAGLPSTCSRTTGWFSRPDTCVDRLEIEQRFPGCGGSPDELHLTVRGFASEGSLVEIERGAEGARVPAASFTAPQPPFTLEVVMDVTGVPEGPVAIHGRTVPPDPVAEPPAEADAIALLDRTVPQAEVLLPPEGGLLCETASGPGAFLTLRVLATDASPRLDVSAKVRAVGGVWSALARTCLDDACREDPSVATGVPVDLAWSSSGLAAGDYEAQVGFCDRSGNQGWTSRHFTLTREVKPRVLSISRRRISPNGDGRADDVEIHVRLAESARLTVRVHRDSEEGPVVRTLQEGQPYPATDTIVVWDGRGDDGLPVPDGPYVAVFSTENACGGRAAASAAVEVDATPPEVAVVQPVPDQAVVATVDVRGRVSDLHLSVWTLEVACDPPDQWSVVATNRNQISPEGPIAAWDSSRAPPGSCALRLAAEDDALNRAEVVVPVRVEGGGIIRRLVANPEVFSPNGDGRRETVQIEYELETPARVTLQIRDAGATVLRTLVAGVLLGSGPQSVTWNGLDGAGSPAPEGDLVAWLRAEDPDDAAVHEEQTARVTLDRTPPALSITTPAPASLTSAARPVRGSIGDARLVEYVLSITPGGGAPSELARDSHARSDEVLAPLADFGDGPYTLELVASDLAENQASLTVPFTIDSTPPQAALLEPAKGATLLRGDEPVPVTGSATDENLEGWTLRFGPGAEPAALTTIASGTEGGDTQAVGAWDVRFVPDGVYTTSLLVTDRAGNAAEDRATVTLDGTPPVVALAHPTGGGYVTERDTVLGTVDDTHLASWRLEAAPGDAQSAFEWALLESGDAPVQSGPLAEWSPLPRDGVYTLRLTGRDEVGLTSEARVTLTVDTSPPAAPTGLKATLTPGEREGHGKILLTWNPNTEPDLAGYRVARAGAPEEDRADVKDPAWDDGERVEGRYEYSVVAVDEAGHESPPATLAVLVDLTPPTVAFLSPSENASVAGTVEIRGTAFSADDFAEYRLLVGAGTAPATWTLLRRSTLPVSAGGLGEWLALADGPYVLALEADDIHGNRARITRPVAVDTVAPEPPVLVEVAHPPAPGDRLVPTWQPSPSSDVAGYLVYRNAHLANATTLVLGDLTGFLVSGPSYDDDSLPDGEHCYHVLAVDGAGNESTPSNEICATLDNRAPHAVIVQPSDGTRFSYPVRVVADTPDLDVATIQFEIRASGEVGWGALDSPRLAPPWETTLDPATPPLVPGAYELRAVATDDGGHVDPDPAIVTIVFGDTEPPPAPEGLVARVEATDVTLGWTPSGAADFASYRLYRDGERIADGLTDVGFVDRSLDPGSYAYVVTAVDGDGNESPPSAPASAVVYTLTLDDPAWPVTLAPSVALGGAGSQPATVVTILREGAPVAAGDAEEGAFRVEDVPIAPEGNLLRARGEDADGNRSVVSNEVVMIGNSAPSAVADLAATVDGRDVSLEWTPVAASDLFGYLVRRDGTPLTASGPQRDVLGFAATESAGSAPAAFDQNPATAWAPYWTPAEWTVRFPAPVLVDRIHLRFTADPADEDAQVPPARYAVLTSWEGRWLPLVRVSDNTSLVADHLLPSAFATDALRVSLESPGGLAEVTVDRLDVVPAGTSLYHDDDVPDGRHQYAVSAVDRYGAEGEAGRAEAPVGDVDPPGAPTGLVATVELRDVALTWNANPEPDVVGYALLRDGVRIGQTATPAYRDAGLPDGVYVYTVIAIDASGLESPESAPAEATVAVPVVPPAPPVILEPTMASDPIVLAASRTDVAGRADANSLVSLEVDGEPRGTAPAIAGFLRSGVVDLSAGYGVAFSPDGRLAAWRASSSSIAVQDLESGEVRLYPHGGDEGGWTLAFSPDGSTLAFPRRVAGGSATELVALRLADGAVSPLSDGSVADFAWSPDGSRLALSLYTSPGTTLGVLDVGTGVRTDLDASAGTDERLRWSPDGAHIAFVRRWSGEVVELRAVSLDDGQVTTLDELAWSQAVPSWAPDGRRVAWTTASGPRLEVRVADLSGAEPSVEIGEASADLVDPRFATSGDWLSFVRLQDQPDGPTLRWIVARRGVAGTSLDVRGPDETWSVAPPDAHEWLGGRLVVRDGSHVESFAPEAGLFRLRDVALAPGENHLVARAGDPTTGLTSPDSETVLVTVPEESFPNLVVEPSDVDTVPPVPVAGRAGQVRVRVRNAGSAAADAFAVQVRVLDPDGALVADDSVEVAGLAPGESVRVSVPWTPARAGVHSVLVDVDPDHLVAESRRDDNEAEALLTVAETEGLVAEIASDRASYAHDESAAVTVAVANAGPPFSGTATTVVEDASAREVARLDERAVSLDYGRRAEWTLTWPTGATWAGPYRFRIGVRADGEETDRAGAERAFTIEADESLAASVRPRPGLVAAGAPAAFALHVDNLGANAPLENATVRLRVQAEGVPSPVAFETVRTLPLLLPGTTWEATDVWSSAQPPGLYTARLDVEKAGGGTLASATAPLVVDSVATVVRGSLAVSPAEVLAGDSAEAHVTVSDAGTLPMAGYPLAVEVVSGPEATVHLSAPATVDLAVGETRELVLTLDTAGLAPSSYVVLLRGGGSAASLDRAGLVVHGPIAPPSPHAPAEGASVATPHPLLVVNDASSSGGATLTYEFQIFMDAALARALPGATGVSEEASWTSWRVAAALTEDARYWWRARATDGFSTSPWSAVASFVVDAVNRPPSAPVADTPAAGSRVPSRQPALTVRNALDPEGQPLRYEFRLASGPDMADVVVSAADVAEGLGLTTWTVPLTLEENAFYYWSARASDGVNLSPWSAPAAFQVDSVNESPSAPVPLSPVDGHDVATLTPALVVANATDPEGDPVQYRFEIDVHPELDSPDRQASPSLPEGSSGQTSWTPPGPLVENTAYFWRAHASDGNTETPSVVTSFFVNVANDPPSAPVPLDPVDGRTVGTATPALRLRNATDPESDPLTYELVVHDASGAIVAQGTDVPAGNEETEWTVPVGLEEDADFTWSARASDGELTGPWSAPAAFRVDAVVEPPTAPVPLLPAEGSTVEESRPPLVVENATSPDGLPLRYTFELFSATAGGSVLVERATDLPEGTDTTAWTPTVDLPDGDYEWRARASDPTQDGPWSTTARFEVRLDSPPAPPTGLHATPGDGRVELGWNASTEVDVTGYRVYRSETSGGPYAPVGSTAAPEFEDLGLTNGVTFYYVVTALDARSESGPSAEASARPEAPAALVMEVRYEPSTLDAACLLARGHGHRGKDPHDRSSALRAPDAAGGAPGPRDATRALERGAPGAECRWPPSPSDGCPTWLYATLELPAGYDPSSIDLRSLRLLGSVRADWSYDAIVDIDKDGIPERRVRFPVEDVAPLLAAGDNEVTIVGEAGASEVRGAARIVVLPLSVDLRISPRTINRRSHGDDVLAAIGFPRGVPAREASVSSIRLNEAVPVERVVEVHDEEMKVKFDRKAVIAVLPLGKSVEVRVTGTLHGLPFVGVDHVKVIE
jgi:subtilase family serine protease/flagellar hook assembly protein FlgD